MNDASDVAGCGGCRNERGTESREETSTIAVLTSKPASLRTFAATSAFSCRKSASTTRLPALTRRAIA